jgi:H+/Cl- antiporter ClcA
VIGAGQSISGLVPLLRILLAAIYLGGGNTLGTEGPIIHLAACLATFQLKLVGIRSRKMLSMFAVVGAEAGISAGFKVIITGFVFTIEELTRSLTQRSALIITLSTGVATLVKKYLEDLLHHFVHIDKMKLVPKDYNWEKLTETDIVLLLLFTIPIGAINGVFGWVFARCAWKFQAKINPRIVHKEMGKFHRMILPEPSHLAWIGLVSALLGVCVYEIAGVNGVWGTTVGAIPETLKKGLGWEKVGVMFIGKFIAMTLATAVGGPGGTLVPSLAAGGLVGIFVGRLFNLNDQSVASCAVIGMGSLFASVMHMPVTGVIMMFELTWAHKLLVHIIIGNFIASNVVHRLPHGTHSFTHLCLEHDPLWTKLGGQDFIETDEQARIAFFNEGIGKIASMSTFALRWWLLTDLERLRLVFHGWHQRAERTGGGIRKELQALDRYRRRYLAAFLESSKEGLKRLAWRGLHENWREAKLRRSILEASGTREEDFMDAEIYETSARAPPRSSLLVTQQFAAPERAGT